MLRQIVVQKRVVGVEQRQDRAVVLQEVSEEEDRLLLHRPTQGGERGKHLLTLLVVLCEAVHVEPLRAEFLREPPRLPVAEHPPCLREQDLRLVQPPGRGRLEQFCIGQRRPKEITQPRGQFGIVHRLRPGPRPRCLGLIEEGGGHEHAGEREGEGLLVRQVVAAEFGIEFVQLTRLLRAERPPVGLRGEGLQLR